MRLRELQNAVDQWIAQYDAGYWPPLANLARLTEEVGELAREINHAHGPKQKKSQERPSTIEDELGDILFTVATLANSLGVDLESAAAAALHKATVRDGDRWKRKAEPPAG